MTPPQRPLSPARGTTSPGPVAFSSEYEDWTMAIDRMAQAAPTSLAFGPFRLFPRQRLLTVSGKPVHIGSRAFDILVALLERPGDLVSKQELIARVWPSTIVEQANLAVQIAGLRRALGDGRRGNRYVINIPGRGYRFVATVAVESKTPTEPAPWPPRQHNLPAPSTQRIAGSDGDDQLGQTLQRRLLAILRSGGIGKTKAALALVESLLEAKDERVFVLDVTRSKKQ